MFPTLRLLPQTGCYTFLRKTRSKMNMPVLFLQNFISSNETISCFPAEITLQHKKPTVVAG
jgi:hypothetical protein